MRLFTDPNIQVLNGCHSQNTTNPLNILGNLIPQCFQTPNNSVALCFALTDFDYFNYYPTLDNLYIYIILFF